MTESEIGLMAVGKLHGGQVDWNFQYPRIFDKVSLPKGRTLDVGSNDARFSRWLKAVDINPEVISLEIRERSYFKEIMVREDGHAIPFLNDSFDEVVSFHALPVFSGSEEEEAIALNEMLRVAKKRVVIWPTPMTWTEDANREEETNVREAITSHLNGALDLNRLSLIEIIPVYCVATHIEIGGRILVLKKC